MTLTLSNLSLTRGRKTLLRDATFSPLLPGEFTVLAGPNGAGKSSLLRAIAQTLPYRGMIAHEGRDLSRMQRRERAALLGYMPQNLQSQSDLSVLEGLFVAMNAGGRNALDRAGQLARAEALLKRFDISHLAGRRLSALSGGQRQTVGLAQALARNPALILLDEPTAALDLAMQFRILGEIAQIAADGRIVIAVLHDLTQAARWADRIILMHDGIVRADGPPAEVLTPGLLKEVYHVDARVERDSRNHLIISVDGTFPVSACQAHQA